MFLQPECIITGIWQTLERETVSGSAVAHCTQAEQAHGALVQCSLCVLVSRCIIQCLEGMHRQNCPPLAANLLHSCSVFAADQVMTGPSYVMSHDPTVDHSRSSCRLFASYYLGS